MVSCTDDLSRFRLTYGWYVTKIGIKSKIDGFLDLLASNFNPITHYWLLIHLKMASLKRCIPVALLFVLNRTVQCLSLSTNGCRVKHDASVELQERRAFLSKSLTLVVGLASSVAHAEVSEDYIEGPRGLRYKIVKPADDPSSSSPQRAQNVKAKYTLYVNGFPDDTPNSKKIDSSSGLFGEKPFGFLAGVSQVIKGWDLAIMDMKVGEARRLIVPSDLGYGEKGAGGSIPGGATLYFDVELAEIGALAKLGPEQSKWLEENPI